MLSISEVASFVLDIFILYFKAGYLTLADIVFKCLPKRKKSVKDEVVLITGAGHGLGRELSFAFAGLGAKVVLWSKTKSRVQEAVDSIRNLGGIAYGYDVDVSDEVQVEKTSQKVRKEVGDVTMIINNAGVLPGKLITDLSCEEIRRTINVNLLSHYWTIKQFLPKMKERKHGHIIAINSVAGLCGVPYLSDYSASKFAMRGLMASLKEDLHVDNCDEDIHLTLVYPAIFGSGMIKKPKTKYPSIFRILSTKEVCQKTVEGILRNEDVIVIPKIAYYIFWIKECFATRSVDKLIQRFSDYGMDSS